MIRVELLLDSFVDSLRSDGRFSTSEAVSEGGEEEEAKEPEETLAWTLFLRAQLEERTGFLQEAADTLEVRAGNGEYSILVVVVVVVIP